MARVQQGRFTADVDTLGDEVVVFVIGMRINKPLKVRSWWPVFTHLEAWRRFNRQVHSTGDVGIWHETYRVRTDSIESIYGNMPVHGLAAVAGSVPVTRGRDSAAARIGASSTDEPVLPPY